MLPNTMETVSRLREHVESLTDAEKQTLRSLIETTYQGCDGDFSKTAETLGLNRYQLYRLVRRLGWKRRRLMSLGETAPAERA
jgi:DNA-binding NtrC family response regulator